MTDCSIFGEQFLVQKLARRKALPILREDHFARRYVFGRGVAPRYLHARRIHERKLTTGRNARARFHEDYAKPLFVEWFQPLVMGRRDAAIAGTFVRTVGCFGGDSILVRGPSDVRDYGGFAKGADVSEVPA